MYRILQINQPIRLQKTCVISIKENIIWTTWDLNPYLRFLGPQFSKTGALNQNSASYPCHETLRVRLELTKIVLETIVIPFNYPSFLRDLNS